MRQIVVGTDGSEQATAALAFAGRLASETGAVVTVVRLTRLTPPSMANRSLAPARSGPDHSPEPGALRAAPGHHSQACAGVIQTAVEVLDSLGVGWQLECGHGDPATELESAAARHGADLIVVEGRGHTAAHRLLVESLSTRLIHHADRPVAVVR